MKKHFYLDWYGERGFSKTLVSELQKHITNRKPTSIIHIVLPTCIYHTQIKQH